MKVKVFTLPWRPDLGGFDDGEVVSFLAERTAIDVSEHFFVHEKMPVLVLVVTYRPGAATARPGPAGTRKRGADPTADLTADERRRYEALRTWRNQHARKTGRPPYVVFTNRQAADIARRAPATRAELGEVQGIGASRVEDFGNFYLGPVDRLVTRGLRAGGYCRYMDDILVFADSKAALWDGHRRIEELVRTRLDLELKPEVTRVLPVSEGVPFLGFVVFPGTVRFDRHRARRWRSRMRALQRALDRGDVTGEDAQRAADSLIGWARHGDTFSFRRAWVERRS